MTRYELRSALEKQGITVEELAAVLSVDANYARGWLLGEHPVPGRVAHYFSTGEIVTRYGPVLRSKSDEVARFRASIARMCEACEPDLNKCRDAECPLRPVSPFDLADNRFGPIDANVPMYDGVESEYGNIPEGSSSMATPRDTRNLAGVIDPRGLV